MRKTEGERKTVNLNLRMDEHLYIALRRRALDERTNMSEIVREMISERVTKPLPNHAEAQLAS